MQYQSTLRSAITFDGPGLHSGVPCRVQVVPAAPNFGLQFNCAGVTIPALAEYVVETARATVVGKGGVRISTVEHLLSALFGMGIANAEIVVDGPEIPVADGSARVFAETIAQAGIVRQPEPRKRYVPASPSFVRDGERVLIILPAASFRVRFLADFPAPIGTQYFDGEVTSEMFMREVSAARTFGFAQELEALRARGLAKGGTLENAVVFTPEGPLQTLRWPDEPVRHKVLDLLGDFALLGYWPQCEVFAVKSGHKLHCIATNELRRKLGSTLPAARVQ